MIFISLCILTCLNIFIIQICKAKLGINTPAPAIPMLKTMTTTPGSMMTNKKTPRLRKQLTTTQKKSRQIKFKKVHNKLLVKKQSHKYNKRKQTVSKRSMKRKRFLLTKNY